MTKQPKEWYSPAEIRFSRYQVIWILEHLDSLSAGFWPPDFKVTGYSGKKKGGINKRAYFDNPIVIAAEVKRRLKLTKTDGKLLKAQVQGGITEFKELEWESQTALNFLSLWDFRKRPNYSVWRWNSKYYQKTRAKIKSIPLKKKKRKGLGSLPLPSP